MDLKIRLNDIDIRLLERVSDITGTETGLDKDGWINIDYILATLDDLQDAYSDLEERFSDYVQDVDDNFRRKTLKESYE